MLHQIKKYILGIFEQKAINPVNGKVVGLHQLLSECHYLQNMTEKELAAEEPVSETQFIRFRNSLLATVSVLKEIYETEVDLGKHPLAVCQNYQDYKKWHGFKIESFSDRTFIQISKEQA